MRQNSCVGSVIQSTPGNGTMSHVPSQSHLPESLWSYILGFPNSQASNWKGVCVGGGGVSHTSAGTQVNSVIRYAHKVGETLTRA